MATISIQHGKYTQTDKLHFERDDIIYHSDEMATYQYFIIHGVVRICHYFMDGSRQITRFLYEGDIIRQSVESCGASAEAVTPLILRKVETAGICADSDVQLRKDLRHALDDANHHISILARKTAAERIAAFLISMEKRQQGHGRLALCMSRADIADYLGLNAYTVSRTIGDLARHGLIYLVDAHHIAIADARQLSQFAGMEFETIA